MRRTATIALALAIVLTSCGRGPTTPPARGSDSTSTPTTEANETNEPASVDIVRSGFTIHGEQVGVGAIVRVDGSSARREITLEIAYYAAGRQLGDEEDMLAFCPARTECPWGQTFVGETLGSNWESIDEVRVRVRDGGDVGEAADVEQLSTSVGDDSIVIQRSGVEGTAYVLVFDGPTPRFASSFYTPDGERRAVTYPRDDFPPAPADAFKTYFYPGPGPGSVYGPVD